MNVRNSLTGALLIFLMVFSYSCKPGNKAAKTGVNGTNSFHILAKKELGDKFMVEFNEPGNYVLCKSGFLPDPSVSHYTVKFFVYDVDKEEIIYQDVVPRGEVDWHNHHTIRISSLPGIIMPDAEIVSNIYLYDFVAGKKTTLGSTEKF